MGETVVRVEADVNPTESDVKVRRAIENIFGSIPIEAKPLRKGIVLVAETHGSESLIKLYNMLRRERIRSAARMIFLEGSDRHSISFCLNKQVALAGHVSFAKEVAESPLGPIRIRITCENPRTIIDWLTSQMSW